jgi:hypothetical protein
MTSGSFRYLVMTYAGAEPVEFGPVGIGLVLGAGAQVGS